MLEGPLVVGVGVLARRHEPRVAAEAQEVPVAPHVLCGVPEHRHRSGELTVQMGDDDAIDAAAPVGRRARSSRATVRARCGALNFPA